MTLKCDSCNRDFGSETALSMHLKDKHGITDSEETAKILEKADSKSYKLSGIIRERKDLVIVSVSAILIILSVSAVILKFHIGYPAPDLGNMTSEIIASMGG